jgi:adenosylcobinamide-phosphate synthase
MAAMALLLGVQLGKPGVYALNENGRQPQAGDTERAVGAAGRVVAALACVAVAVLMAWAWMACAGKGMF